MRVNRNAFVLSLIVFCWLELSCSADKIELEKERATDSIESHTVIDKTPIDNNQDKIWLPEIGLSWQWQLTDLPVDLSVEADVYDIDLFDNGKDVVDKLHNRGRRVMCYLSVGSREDWRPDAGLFPSEVVGNKYQGWPGERWLDIRRIDLLVPILSARLDMCQAKGFDGVEADNVDGYLNDTGFMITYEDQLAFNIWLAREAHARGLSIGLKNDAEQIADLLPYFDWALTESCFEQGWCEQMAPFIEARKAVIDTEYSATDVEMTEICKAADSQQIYVILKDRDLTAYRLTCDDF